MKGIAIKESCPKCGDKLKYTILKSVWCEDCGCKVKTKLSKDTKEMMYCLDNNLCYWCERRKDDDRKLYCNICSGKLKRYRSRVFTRVYKMMQKLNKTITEEEKNAILR